MTSIRGVVRTRIPFSTNIYEHFMARRQMAPTARKVSRILDSGQPVRVDLGGGGPGANGWLSVDQTQTCDLYWDLRRGIPFPASSVDDIYSSHFFEHLTYPEGQSMLAECMRVLKPGGIFSICVPNARMYAEGYLGLRELPDEYLGWEPALNRTTRIDALNYVAYMAGEHKYLFDLENLLHLLGAAGFVDVRERAFEPLIDRLERDFESIYALGRKP